MQSYSTAGKLSWDMTEAWAGPQSKGMTTVLQMLPNMLLQGPITTCVTVKLSSALATVAGYQPWSAVSCNAGDVCFVSMTAALAAGVTEVPCCSCSCRQPPVYLLWSA